MRTQDLADDHLLQQGIIHLPSDIRAPFAENLAANVAYFRNKEPNAPIRLFCVSDGGSADETLAGVNVIRMDGNFEGHLLSNATSGGSVLWAACQKRYVYPYSKIGIHPCAWRMETVTLTAAQMYSKFLDFRGVDRAMARIYTEASNKPFQFWWRLINRPGDIKWLSAEQLVEMNMAGFVQQKPTTVVIDGVLREIRYD